MFARLPTFVAALIGVSACGPYQPAVPPTIGTGVVMKCDWASDVGPTPLGPFAGGPSTCRLFLVATSGLPTDGNEAAAAWFASVADHGEPLVATEDGLLEHELEYGTYVGCSQGWFPQGCASFELTEEAPLVIAHAFSTAGTLLTSWERLGEGADPMRVEGSFVEQDVVLACIEQLKREGECSGSSVSTAQAADVCVALPVGSCDGGFRGQLEYWECLASGTCSNGSWSADRCDELSPACPDTVAGP